MLQTKPSILSAGAALYEILSKSLKNDVTKVFPVVTDEATLPYICYRREGLEATPVKYIPSADTALFSVACFAATYQGSVTLAEAVRSILDGYEGVTEQGLYIRSCMLTDAKEEWNNDAYVQMLTFTVRA